MSTIFKQTIKNSNFSACVTLEINWIYIIKNNESEEKEYLIDSILLWFSLDTCCCPSPSSISYRRISVWAPSFWRQLGNALIFILNWEPNQKQEIFFFLFYWESIKLVNISNEGERLDFIKTAGRQTNIEEFLKTICLFITFYFSSLRFSNLFQN